MSQIELELALEKDKHVKEIEAEEAVILGVKEKIKGELKATVEMALEKERMDKELVRLQLAEKMMET